MSIEFKICGLTRAVDARAAEAAGATYGGVILARGSRRSVTPEAAAEIFAGTSLRRCGIFVDGDIDSVLHRARVLELSIVQLHGGESPEYAGTVRESGHAVWKAVRPRDAAEFREAVERYAQRVDGLLLDGWSATAAGGTGTRFPWELIAPERELISEDIQLVVAGGLHPGNVDEVVRLLAPDVVDVSSGVELSPGEKDPGLIRAFAAAVEATAVRGGVA